jgi:hypothetical protein
MKLLEWQGVTPKPIAEYVMALRHLRHCALA